MTQIKGFYGADYNTAASMIEPISLSSIRPTRRGGKRKSYKYLSISTPKSSNKAKDYTRYLGINFTLECLIKANFQIGDYIDFIINPTTSQVVLQKVYNGGWMISDPTKKSGKPTTKGRLSIPIYKQIESFIPQINETIEIIKSIHFDSRNGRLVFNLAEAISGREKADK